MAIIAMSNLPWKGRRTVARDIIEEKIVGIQQTDAG
jgi:hypothetical protein